MTIGAALVVVAGSCAGGFVSGVSGFAFGLVAMICWVWRLEPQLVVPMVVFGSLVTQSTAITVVRYGLHWPRLLPLLIGGLVGVPVGILFLGVIDVGVFKEIVGAVIIAFSLFLLLAPPHPAVRVGGRLADGAAGFVGGAMGGFAGLNGLAPILWCMLRGWDKNVQRGVIQAFVIETQALTLGGYALNGRLTWTVLQHFALMLPAVILSARLGARVCERINAVLFRRIVLVLLSVSGSVLVVSELLRH